MGQPAASSPTQLVTKKSEPLSPLGFALRGVDSRHLYLATRGIEISTAERFGIGFYRGAGIFSGRLVTPVHDERGQLVAYCGRTVDDTEPRYRFSPGLPQWEVVFKFASRHDGRPADRRYRGRLFRLLEAVQTTVLISSELFST